MNPHETGTRRSTNTEGVWLDSLFRKLFFDAVFTYLISYILMCKMSHIKTLTPWIFFLKETVFLSKYTAVLFKCSDPKKKGSEAGGKSTQAVTSCHLSLQPKSLCCWTHLLPCSVKQETDSCWENSLQTILSAPCGPSRAGVKVNHKILNYRWKLCELCGYESKPTQLLLLFFHKILHDIRDCCITAIQYRSVVLLDNLGLISDIYTLNFLNSFEHVPLDISYCREKENRPVLDLFFFPSDSRFMQHFVQDASPRFSALCQADPDCDVRPNWNLKAGFPFHIRCGGGEVTGRFTKEPLVHADLFLSCT